MRISGLIWRESREYRDAVSSLLKKLQTQKGGRFFENAEANEVMKPWRKNQIVLTRADFPDLVKITLANRVYIEKAGLTEQALSHLKRMAVFHNPAFYQAQASRMSA